LPTCSASLSRAELAPEVTRTALGFGLDEIVATIQDRNAASRRVLEKAGFVTVGPLENDPGAVLLRYARR
jgi:RimJ/RimL family protein N-acetyltransferase